LIESIRAEHDDDGLNWVDGVKKGNLDGDASLESMRDFVSAESPFYPGLRENFRRREEDWYERALEARMELCTDCGEKYDPYHPAEEHFCPELEARLDREREEKERLQREREAFEEPLVAPFREEMAQALTDYQTLDTRNATGGGYGHFDSRVRAGAVAKYVRDHVIQKRKMPTGKHSVEWRYMGHKPRSVVVDFDTLAEDARRRREGTVSAGGVK
jgi:hypothetical protein